MLVVTNCAWHYWKKSGSYIEWYSILNFVILHHNMILHSASKISIWVMFSNWYFCFSWMIRQVLFSNRSCAWGFGWSWQWIFEISGYAVLKIRPSKFQSIWWRHLKIFGFSFCFWPVAIAWYKDEFWIILHYDQKTHQFMQDTKIASLSFGR